MRHESLVSQEVAKLYVAAIHLPPPTLPFTPLPPPPCPSPSLSLPTPPIPALHFLSLPFNPAEKSDVKRKGARRAGKPRIDGVRVRSSRMTRPPFHSTHQVRIALLYFSTQRIERAGLLLENKRLSVAYHVVAAGKCVQCCSRHPPWRRG